MRGNRHQARQRRHQRIRRKVRGTQERPRLCIHKSVRHIYAQVVDDAAGTTLTFVTTNTKDNKAQGKSFCNIEAARKLGGELGRRATEKGVATVVFDRGGYRYHGVVQAFADAAREAGLKF
jgi:large subunit ribosomal protein L18